MSGMFSTREFGDDYHDRYDDGYESDDFLPMNDSTGDRSTNPMDDMFREPAGDFNRFDDYFDNSYGLQGPSTRPSSHAFDPPVDGGPRTPTLFSDHLIEEMAHERSIDLPRREIWEDEELGQRKGTNESDTLHGIWTDDYRQRPSLLMEPLPGGMIPTARETMPELTRGPYLYSREQSTRERTFPGHNDSMPEGAVGYIGRDEEYGFGHRRGPSMWPAEAVDEEFMRRREEDSNWSPPDWFPEERTRWPGDGRY